MGNYFIEIGFVNHSFIKCSKCKSPNFLSLINKNDRLDGCIKKFNNKIIEMGEDLLPRKRHFGSYLSFRTESWFSHSHLTIH